MPRYYFHLFNGEVCRDEEGADLPNKAVALQHAATTARAMAADSVSKGHLVLHHRIDITDEGDDAVGTVHFSDVVTVRE